MDVGPERDATRTSTLSTGSSSALPAAPVEIPADVEPAPAVESEHPARAATAPVAPVCAPAREVQGQSGDLGGRRIRKKERPRFFAYGTSAHTIPVRVHVACTILRILASKYGQNAGFNYKIWARLTNVREGTTI